MLKIDQILWLEWFFLILFDAMYVEDVEDSCCMLHVLCKNNVEDVEDIKTSHNRFLRDFLEFISLLLEMLKMCTNYNVDSNTKSLNYSKIRFKPLIYFQLQQSLS